MIRLEVLVTKDTSRKGRNLLDKLVAGAARHGLECVRTAAVQLSGDWLVVYGAGEARRAEAVRQYQAAGRPVLCWDLGYWQRDRANLDERMYRVSVGGLHPLAPGPVDPARYAATGPALEEIGAPDGPVVLCGVPPKSRTLYPQALSWEADAARAIRAAFPDRRVLYRAKPGRPASGPAGVKVQRECSVRDGLRGASLAVVRFSNVAVDCAALGVPCVVAGGIGRWLWPTDMVRTEPSRQARRAFLEQVAMWQWTPAEAARGQAWEFLKAVCG